MIRTFNILALFILLNNADGCKSSNKGAISILGHFTDNMSATNCPHITYAHGLLMNSKGIECKYSINGNVFSTTSMATRVPLHGLLRYDCGDCSGSIILRGTCSECDDCITVGNEHLCLNPSSAFYWGLGAGLLISVIVGAGIYVLIRFVENRSNHAETFNSLTKKKEKNSDDETDSDDMNLNMYSCPPMMVYGISLMLLMSPIDAIYLQSQNTHCSNNNCIDFMTVSMNLVYGSPKYLTLDDGSQLEVGISSLENLDYYRKIYDTCDYDIEVSTVYSCKGAGNCWYNGDCRPYTRPTQFSWNETVVSNGGCFEVATSCDTFCFYNRACVYYKWELKPVGQMSEVYTFDFRSWRSRIYMKKGNVTTYIDAGSMQDMAGWDEVEYKYPVEVSLMPGNTREPEKSIISLNGLYISVDSSPLGKPVPSHIGDYQINDGVSFNTFSVNCATTSCHVDCRHPTPAIRKVTVIDKLKCEKREQRLICKQALKNELLVHMGTDGIHNEVSYPSKCEISIEATWSCRSCPYPSNFVVRPYNVKGKGHIKIESNCTLNPPYLLCSDHPYSVEVVGDSKYCVITSSSLNMTKVIHIRTIDDGPLAPDYGIIDYGSSSWSQWSNIVTSPSYILGLQNMISYSLVAMVVTLIIRYSLAFYMINKAGKNTAA
jgi:hypothetical protein